MGKVLNLSPNASAKGGTEESRQRTTVSGVIIAQVLSNKNPMGQKSTPPPNSSPTGFNLNPSYLKATPSWRAVSKKREGGKGSGESDGREGRDPRRYN